MRRILATFRNELLLFCKDIAGISLLFLMPVILTIIMAIIQDAPFREYQDLAFDVLWVDNDHGQLAKKMEEGLDNTKQFHLIKEIGGQPLTDSTAKEYIRKGDYKIGIVVPKGVTAEVVNSANQIANEIGKKIGAPGSLPQRESRDSCDIQIYFDPATRQTFKLSILNALEKYITKAEAEMAFARIGKTMRTHSGEDTSNTELSFNLDEKIRSVGIKELAAVQTAQANLSTNSVQHNVPAWAIFGLFFIIIPIAGNMIREREDGSLVRLKLIPGWHIDILLGKLLFYVLVGIAQFYLMLQVGVYILPKFGLPALYMGHAPLALLAVITAISITATSYGVCIGALFHTPNQALPFGAISIVILSAIGGIWIPVDILPGKIKALASISPLHWSLESINDIFLRSAGFTQVLPKILVLILFSVVFMGIAGLMEMRRKS